MSRPAAGPVEGPPKAARKRAGAPAEGQRERARRRARGGGARNPGSSPGEVDVQTYSRAFHALGHPHRLTIVRALLARDVPCCSGEHVEDCRMDPASCNVGELAALVDAAPSTLSHHLKTLEAAGVIERARDGRYLYCRVDRSMLDDLANLLVRRSVADGEQAGALESRPYP